MFSDIFWVFLDYNHLYAHTDQIREFVKKHDIDILLYSRNDQVLDRILIGQLTRNLRIGYSSFSGIDNKFRVGQSLQCLQDLTNNGVKLSFGTVENNLECSHEESNNRTFSIIFDTEQLGGVRFGLSRLLQILNRHNVKATFFLTNLMKQIYVDITEEISKRGHEVGCHGLWHEYLSDYEIDKQEEMIDLMIENLEAGVKGANFISRMNADTIRILLKKKFKYFLFPRVNYLSFATLPSPSNPVKLNEKNNTILGIPLLVDTYNLPWFSIKCMIDDAIKFAKFQDSSAVHLTILCHPFRDGNLDHLSITERMLAYLKGKGLTPVTLDALVKGLGETASQSMDVANFCHMSEKMLPIYRRVKLECSGAQIARMAPESLIQIYRTCQWRNHRSAF